jgi:hypothetical protein
VRFGPTLFRAAAVCGALSALTTLGVHLLPSLYAGADTFEKQLLLRENPIYLGRLWIVVLHCLLVVVAMFGVGVRLLPRAPALAVLGFLSFVVFGLTELLRTSLGIFALNRAWRGGYAAATDDTTRAYFRAQIAGFGGWNDGLFLLFALAFFLGTLLYGLALRRGQGLEKTVGIVLLVWSIFGGHAVLEEASGFGPLAPYLGWVGPGFQPLARLLTAVWLWRTAGEPVGRAA